MLDLHYVWPGFVLTLDRQARTVFTVYEDGRWTGGEVVPADHEHAALLGTTPLRHRLAHELAHHVLAEARCIESPAGGCRILYRSAHQLEQDLDEAALDEWYITVFTYHALGRNMRDAGEYGALIDLQRAGVDLARLGACFRWLLEAADHASVLT